MAHETVSGTGPDQLSDASVAVPATGEQPDERDGGKGRRLRWSRPVALRAAAAVAAGLVMFLAFPPDYLSGHKSAAGIWALAPVGVAVFTLAVRGVPGRRGAWLGLVTGLAFFLPLLDWVRVIGLDAWAGLGLVQAAYYVPLGAGTAVATRLRGWPVWTAALWVAEEYVRGRWPFGGLPWGRLAFSQTASPLTPYAALGGAPLVSFITALIGALLALLVLRRPWRVRAGAVAGGAALGLAGLLVPVPTSGKPVTVAVVQGNVPRSGLDFLGQREAVLNNHVQRTLELARQVKAGKLAKPSLVVWPENSSDLDPYTDPDAKAKIAAAVDAIGVPVLVGAVVDDPGNPDKVQNRGIVWDPVTGPGAYYVKRHPVPFGEYIPFRDVLTKLIKRFSLVPRDFAAGTKPGLMQLGPVRIGDVICFEVAYDSIVRDVSSAQMLVVQTNNATYGHTSLPWQQLAMSRLRAVEHGRAVLIAATSGITAVVNPDGRILGESAEFTPYVQVARVPARTSRTLADRLGPGPEWFLVALGVGAVAYGAYGSRMRNRTRRKA